MQNICLASNGACFLKLQYDFFCAYGVLAKKKPAFSGVVKTENGLASASVVRHLRHQLHRMDVSDVPVR